MKLCSLNASLATFTFFQREPPRPRWLPVCLHLDFPLLQCTSTSQLRKLLQQDPWHCSQATSDRISSTASVLSRWTMNENHVNRREAAGLGLVSRQCWSSVQEDTVSAEYETQSTSHLICSIRRQVYCQLSKRAQAILDETHQSILKTVKYHLNFNYFQ